MGGNPYATNPLGVTIEDAVVAAVKMWSSYADGGAMAELEEMFDSSFPVGIELDDGEDRDSMKADFLAQMGINRDEEPTWRDTLGERYIWEGIWGAEAVASDVVALQPRSFVT